MVTVSVRLIFYEIIALSKLPSLYCTAYVILSLTDLILPSKHVESFFHLAKIFSPIANRTTTSVVSASAGDSTKSAFSTTRRATCSFLLPPTLRLLEPCPPCPILTTVLNAVVSSQSEKSSLGTFRTLLVSMSNAQYHVRNMIC